MNDTPVTDAFFYKKGCWSEDILAFCRRLERERDEARRDLEFRRRLYKSQEELWEVTRRQRDEARDQVEELTAVIKALRVIMRQEAAK